MTQGSSSDQQRRLRGFARILVVLVGMTVLSSIGVLATPDVAGAAPEDCGLSSPFSGTADADGDGIDDATEVANSLYAVATWGAPADSSDPCDATSFYFEACPTGSGDPVPSGYDAQFNQADTFGIVAPGVEYSDLDELIFIANPALAPAGVIDPFTGAGPDVCDASYQACGVDILTDTPGDWDSDGDGVSNADEVAAGSDPCNQDTLICGVAVVGYDPNTADSDSDGVMDAVESANGTDPCVANVTVCNQFQADGYDGSTADFDADGVSDDAELAAGTDPCVAEMMVCGSTVAAGYDPATTDSDSDGFMDAVETTVGTDPCVASSTPVLVCGEALLEAPADADADGLSDADEVLYGSDPCDAADTAVATTVCEQEIFGYDASVADSDQDGVNDAAETAAGTDPCVAELDAVLVCGVEVVGYDAATADSDGDGSTDAAETAAGSDPCAVQALVCDTLVADYDPSTHDADEDQITDAAETAAGTDICVKDALPFTGFNGGVLFFAATALIVGFAMMRLGSTPIRFNN